MSWREYAESVQKGGDNRDNRDNSPLSAPIAPDALNVPRVVADSLARGWAKALAQVDPYQPHGGIAPDRWKRLHEQSLWWLDSFGEQASRDGWGTGDVFGLRVGYERRGGLIDQLESSRALVMEGKRANWRTYGVKFTYAAGAYPNLPAWWSS
jgi:hypothetical protein